MPEPEAAGAVDVAMVRAALDEAASNPDRGIGGSQYAVLGHYTLPKVLDALEQANARAERLEAELAEIHARGYGHLYANELHEQGHRAWMHTPDPAKCWCEPLAGDAPGRGEDG